MDDETDDPRFTPEQAEQLRRTIRGLEPLPEDRLEALADTVAQIRLHPGR